MGKKVETKAVVKKDAVKAPAKTEAKAAAAPKAETKAKVGAKAPAKAEPKKPVVKKETAKKEAPKVSPEKIEIPKIQNVPDACDAVADGFKTKGKVGFYDAASDDCKQCGADYPKAMAACKHNTEVEALLVKEKKATKRTGKAKTPKESTPFGRDVNSGAGKIDLLLLRKEGVTMEEMTKCRGAVSSHLAALKKAGVKIEKKGDRYYAQKVA